MLHTPILLRRLGWAFGTLIAFAILGSLVHPPVPASSLAIRAVPARSELPSSASSSLSLQIAPQRIFQGDPVVIAITGATSTGMIADASVSAAGGGPAASPAGDTAINFGLYQGLPTAFYGVRLSQRPGVYRVIVTLADGSNLSGSFSVSARSQQVEAFPVPASMGGNSVGNQQALVSTLDQDNQMLRSLPKNPDAQFWTAPFAFPVASPVTITDPYGVIRDSGAASIPHLGTDFEAPPGTPVYAIGRGVVRGAQDFTAYGGTVVVDHGLGIESLYMHLSSISVLPGQTVNRGQLVGYSGESGYSEGPHLHLSIWIDGVSVDPMKFFALFGTEP